MVTRSLQVQEQYKNDVEKAFTALGLTQETFAEARLSLSRTTVSKFFNCKPIQRDNFIVICKALNLDWQEIIGLASRVGIAHPTDQTETEIHINGLVNQLRQQVKANIENRCGTMRILDMSQPIGLGKIYTQVNILEKIIGRRRKKIAQLIKQYSLEDFERSNLGKVIEEKIAGKDAVTQYKKLLILGKPGAGYLIQKINNKQQQQRRIFFTQCNYKLLHRFIYTTYLVLYN